MTAALERAETLIDVTPDYPQPGVLFRDLSPVFADGSAMRAVCEAIVEPFRGTFDIVGGIEARGFLLAGYIGGIADAGVLAIRKAGKLPKPAAAATYDLEYGSATIEAPRVLEPAARVLLVDDVLATGGTLAAAQRLIGDLGARVVGSAVALELTSLGGRERAGEVHSVFSVSD